MLVACSGRHITASGAGLVCFALYYSLLLLFLIESLLPPPALILPPPLYSPPATANTYKAFVLGRDDS